METQHTLATHPLRIFLFFYLTLDFCDLFQHPRPNPICRDVRVKNVWLVACKIRTGVRGGEDCLTLHKNTHQYCDSRFWFVTLNETVFLHLTRLTPVDSGLYSCRCIGDTGPHHVDLNIAVIHLPSYRPFFCLFEPDAGVMKRVTPTREQFRW